jgi:hypothetical protein
VANDQHLVSVIARHLERNRLTLVNSVFDAGQDVAPVVCAAADILVLVILPVVLADVLVGDLLAFVIVHAISPEELAHLIAEVSLATSVVIDALLLVPQTAEERILVDCVRVIRPVPGCELQGVGRIHHGPRHDR